MDHRPIGIFDSGFGGLSVWREVVKLLPNEDIIYYGDNANCPYGPKTEAQIQQFCDGITRFLLKKGCKIIIVACNTATAAAIGHLRNTFPLPFVGMEPATKPAALNSKTRAVGVLATEGTFRGKLFLQTKDRFAKDIYLHNQIGAGLVELVEQGKQDSPEADLILRGYIIPMLENGVDHIVLGCTHYPFLKGAIEKIVAGKAEIIDPAPAVAARARHILTLGKKLATGHGNGEYQFYTSGKVENMQGFLSQTLCGTALTDKVYFHCCSYPKQLPDR